VAVATWRILSQDPTPFLLKYPHADVLTSSDHLANTIMGVSPKANFALESPTRAWSAFNIGIIFFRCVWLRLSSSAASIV
jgi:hypothetical protein